MATPTEEVLGGIAALRIYRHKGSGTANVISGWHNPWGYGLYFTDKRLVGVSYTKYLSRAYIPGWILSLGWIGILGLGIAWARATNSPNVPIWFPPLLFATMGASLIVLLYLSPKRASAQIDNLTVSSISQLENIPIDIVLDRKDIDSVHFQRARIQDPGRLFVRGSLFIIRLRNGQVVIFGNSLDNEKLGRLRTLFQTFATRDPAIALTAS